MNTQKTIDFAASYAPPVCKVMKLELDGAVLAASGSFETPVENQSFIEFN